MPELGRGLQQLLDFDGDVEAVMARNFEVTMMDSRQRDDTSGAVAGCLLSPHRP